MVWDGEKRTLLYRLRFEASFAEHLSIFACSVAQGNCPPLFSRQGCSAVGIEIKTNNHVIDIPKVSVFRYKLRVSGAGHYVMRVNEYDKIPKLESIKRRRPCIESDEIVVYFMLRGDTFEDTG